MKYNWDEFDYASVEDLIGKTITSISIVADKEILFTTSLGEQYVMYHEQDCCEHVRIEDICGEIEDLIDSEILMAEVVSQDGSRDVDDDDYYDWGSSTWTFYKFATVKGYVTLRWLGESNGYYSEGVSFVKVKATE